MAARGKEVSYSEALGARVIAAFREHPSSLMDAASIARVPYEVVKIWVRDGNSPEPTHPRLRDFAYSITETRIRWKAGLVRKVEDAGDPEKVAKPDWKAIKFVLERRFKKEWGEQAKPDAAAVGDMESFLSLPRTDRESLLESLAEASRRRGDDEPDGDK
jgi:hypothetical protein